MNVYNSNFDIQKLKKLYKKVVNKKNYKQIKLMNDVYKTKMNSAQIVKELLN